jgi:hypothetical protein
MNWLPLKGAHHWPAGQVELDVHIEAGRFKAFTVTLHESDARPVGAKRAPPFRRDLDQLLLDGGVQCAKNTEIGLVGAVLHILDQDQLAVEFLVLALPHVHTIGVAGEFLVEGEHRGFRAFRSVHGCTVEQRK